MYRYATVRDPVCYLDEAVMCYEQVHAYSEVPRDRTIMPQYDQDLKKSSNKVTAKEACILRC